MLRRVTALSVPLLVLAGCGSSSSTPGTSTTTTTGGGGSGPAAPYSVTAFDAVRITSDSSQPNFQQASADVDLGAGPYASAKLVVDLASTCYPFDNWKTDPPPSGQNWPADCDAFDRNFELSLDDPQQPGDPPGLELERAITPFGGPLHLEIDLTDVANGLPGKHRLRTTIPTWSDGAGKVSGSNGGWNVTARIDLSPGPAPHHVLAVKSLYYDNQNAPESPAPIPFDVPAGTTSARVEWRATGHGGATGGAGCIGPAEEFCHRKQALLVDGTKVADVDPWRKDCAKLCTLDHYAPFNLDYCKENPCGSISSVKASRANWCPGSETPPFVATGSALTAAGSHEFSWTISTVASGGTWRLSATYFAFGD